MPPLSTHYINLKRKHLLSVSIENVLLEIYEQYWLNLLFLSIRLNLTRFISDSSQCTLESYWFSMKGHFSVDFYFNFCMRLCQNIQKVRIHEIFKRMCRSKINIESESGVFCKWSSFEKSDILNCHSLKTTSPCLVFVIDQTLQLVTL